MTKAGPWQAPWESSTAPRQDGSEDAVRFWHDEGAPDSFASAVEDKNAPRRRQASTSTSSRIVLEFRVCGWSEDAWDPALVHMLMGSVETTDERFDVEVPSTAVMDMSGVSAGMSVSMVIVVPADNSPPTLRVDALSPSNGPTTSVSLASLNLTFDEDIQSEGTRTVDLCTNSVAGSGAGCAHAEYADGSFAVHPVTSENVSCLVLDKELHPSQTAHIFFIDARAVLDPSGKPFVGLAGGDFNFAVAEQGIVPNGTVAFPAGEASTTTNIVVSFVESVQLAGNASFRIALQGRAEVLCGKNTVIQKGLQIGHNDCPNAGLDELRGFIFGDQLFIGRYSRGGGKQQALARSKSRTNLQRRFGVVFRTDWHGSIANQFLPVA